MPVHPVTGESLPNPGIGNGLGMEGPRFPSDNLTPPGVGTEIGGQQNRLTQLLEAREMIDQEIATIIGVPPGTENMDMLTPPSIDPRMAPETMVAQGGMPTGAVPGTVPGAVPGMALPGLLGGQYA